LAVMTRGQGSAVADRADDPTTPADRRRAGLVVALGAALLAVALRGGSYDEVARDEAFVAVWWVVALSLAFGVLPVRAWTPTVRVAVAALAGLAAWTAIGLLWSDSAQRTVAEATRALGYTGVVALVACLFRSRDRGTVVGVLIAVGGLVCVLAIVARLAPGTLHSALAASGYARSRLDYPFNYWNSLGCWAAMTLALALAAAVHAPQRWMRGGAMAVASLAPVVAYLTYSRSALASVALAAALVIGLSSRRWLALTVAVASGVAATAIVLMIRAEPEIARGTGSSGAGAVALTAVAAMGLAAAAVLAAPKRLATVRVPRRIWRRRLLPLLAVAAVVGGVAVAPALGARAWNSFKGPETPIGADPAHRLTSLGGTRSAQWAVALSLFADHPLHGIGAGTYEFGWNQDPRRTGHVKDAHSLYLESLAEVGAPGALLVVLALGTLLVTALRRAARAPDGPGRGVAAGCAAAFAVYCVTAGVDWMWESTAITVAALVIGTVAAAGPSRGRRPRWPVRAGGTLVATIVVLLQVPSLVAALQVRASQRAVAQGRPAAAVLGAAAATRTAPWAAANHLQLALALEQIGRLSSATSEARQAVSGEPDNSDVWLVLGRMEAERGRIGPALTAARRARSLNPRSPLFAPGVAEALARRRGP
jgi:hypothetical protein